MKKVLFTATVDSHIMLFHLPYLKYFKEKGYEVHVATSGSEEIPYCDKKIRIPFERSPFKINNLKAIKKLRKVINEEKYELIHTHTPMGSVVTRLAAKKARKSGTKVIYTAHGFHFFKGAPKKNWLIFYPVEKFLAKYTDAIITINEEDYSLAKSKFKTKVYYVHGVGIDEHKFSFNITDAEKEELRRPLGINKEDFIMIYPAELNDNKNQMFLINVMEKLPHNIHLLLPGKDSYNGIHQRIVNEKGLSNIHFLGFRKDIYKLLSISNLSISASKREGLPVNIMEAMYLGLPIVASDCRGNRDLVKTDYNGFLIKQNDEQSFRDAILKIYNNEIDINTFSNNSKKEVEKYLLKNVMKEMSDIYEENTTCTSK